MESALASIILMTVVLYASLTLSHTYFTTQDRLMVSEQALQERTLERMKTDLEIVGMQTKSSGSVIELTVRNSGNIKLADFEKWDVIVEYYQANGDLVMTWAPYTAGSPGNNEWTVAGIYANAVAMTPEAFEPDILNPDEEMIVQIRVLPPVGPDTTNRATIGVPNGDTVSTLFTRTS